jgi:hypothetical protein
LDAKNGRFLEIFNILIHPCILPAEFSGGRLNHSTYEYYQPNMVARQLGCGQMPPRLFLHEFSGNMIVLFSKSDISSPNHDLDFYLQNTVPAPRARAIAYNAVYPISALGFRSPTLAQLLARYATTDPIPFSATADKRKGLSLIAPPAAKKRRTVKKVLIEVKFPIS